MRLDIPWGSSKKTRVVQDNVCLRLSESFHMRWYICTSSILAINGFSDCVILSSEVKSLDVPFGDSFILLVAYDVEACGPDLLQCRLVVRCGIRFCKAVWGMKVSSVPSVPSAEVPTLSGYNLVSWRGGDVPQRRTVDTERVTQPVAFTASFCSHRGAIAAP